MRGTTEEPTSLGEVIIHVYPEEEDTLEIELPSGATVGDLYAATGGGINNLLSFKGTVLADRSASLAEVGISEIGSSTEAVVDSTKIASFAWGKDDLDKMKLNSGFLGLMNGLRELQNQLSEKITESERLEDVINEKNQQIRHLRFLNRSS